MRNLKSLQLALMVLLAFSVTACKPIAILKERASFGSLGGVDACLKAAATSLLSTDETKSLCIIKHQSEIPLGIYSVDGTAKISRYRINATILNEMDDHVITKLSFKVYHYDKNGIETTALGETQSWVLPGTEVNVSSIFDMKNEETITDQWCEKSLRASELKSCKRWDITNVFGIRL